MESDDKATVTPQPRRRLDDNELAYEDSGGKPSMSRGWEIINDWVRRELIKRQGDGR